MYFCFRLHRTRLLSSHSNDIHDQSAATAAQIYGPSPTCSNHDLAQQLIKARLVTITNWAGQTERERERERGIMNDEVPQSGGDEEVEPTD